MSVDARLLLEVAVELGMLTQPQVVQVRGRQVQLQRGGVVLSIGQTLLERKLVTPEQLRKLSAEVAFRKTKSNVRAAVATPRPSPAVQKRSFANYELIEILSEKPHCRVFKARDTSLDRLVVLKVLPSAVASDSQWSERFKREMQLAGQLSHPNIATAYGSSEVDGNSLMVLEYVDGLPLGDRLEREGNLPEKTCWLIAREVAKGLAYATKKGILHRDIKPDNIICGNDGAVKIIDMGLSKALNDCSGLTSEGTTVGTPFYISPEQSRGTANLDARTDIYSLGCTVYHMLTGSVPFLGEQVLDIMVKHVEAPRPDPRELLPEISEGSAHLVMRMMAAHPDDRPLTPEHLIAEIEALLPHLPEPEAMVRPVQNIAASPVSGTIPSFTFETAAPVRPGTRIISNAAPPPSRTPGTKPPTRTPNVAAPGTNTPGRKPPTRTPNMQPPGTNTPGRKPPTRTPNVAASSRTTQLFPNEAQDGSTWQRFVRWFRRAFS